MVQVYCEPLCRRHYSGVLSGAALLRAAVLGGCIVLAFLLAFAPGGFWPKASWDMEQPDVHYSGDAVAVFEGVQAGAEQVWATSPALQDLAAGSTAAATVQSAARLRMYGLAFIEASSPLPGSAFSADGRADALLQLPSLLSQYAVRNLTTVFVPSHRVWTAGASGAGQFLLDVRIRVPPHQLLLYRPSVAESLKWGWVQFLAAFVALWWLAAHFEAVVFRFRVLPTRAVSDAAPAGKGSQHY